MVVSCCRHVLIREIENECCSTSKKIALTKNRLWAMSSTFPWDYCKIEYSPDFFLLSGDLSIEVQALLTVARARSLLGSPFRSYLRSTLECRTVCQWFRWCDPSDVVSLVSSRVSFVPGLATAFPTSTTNVWSGGKTNDFQAECRDILWFDRDRLHQDFRVIEWCDRRSLGKRICNDWEPKRDNLEHRDEPRNIEFPDSVHSSSLRLTSL